MVAILRTCIFLFSLIVFSLTGFAAPEPKRQVILFIWDGLRPDSISEKNTPNLYRLKNAGTWFSDNHSSYPTLTMMNAASFATGNLAGKTGFFGNVLWNPKAQGVDSKGQTVNFKAPVFTEDYKILQDLDQPTENLPLLASKTLFQVAQAANLKTATVGKAGAAYLQSYQNANSPAGIIIDEHNANAGKPLQFDKVITLNALSSDALGVDADFMYPDNVTSDPSITSNDPYAQSNAILMNDYLQKIQSQEKPDLSVIWLRNPDTTEHNYGVGSNSYYTALKDQDQLLGKLLQKLRALNLLDKTDLIIASDHSHSNVSGPLTQFPLRLIRNSMVSGIDSQGYATSGDFRPADLLTRAGFHAYDGQGCQYDPVLSGIKTDGSLVYPIQFDRDGMVCGEQTSLSDYYGHRQQYLGKLFTTPAYRIPALLPKDAIIVANNGGSTYFYVPSHDATLIQKLTSYLQSRQEFGAVFVDDTYTQIPGTLPMSLIHVLNPQKRNPDIIVGSNFDAKTTVLDMPGIEFNSGGVNRGTHGSFSPIDVHNTLLAIGPDFRAHFVDTLPTGNVDVAPTIAYLLKLSLPNTDGRPLLEALNSTSPLPHYTVLKLAIAPGQAAQAIRYKLATNPNGDDVDARKSNYSLVLKSKLLIVDNKNYFYFDSATAKRY